MSPIFQRLEILHRRFSPILVLEPSTKIDASSLPSYSPFTITRVSPVLYTFLCLIALSIAVFALEYTVPTARVMRWLKGWAR